MDALTKQKVSRRDFLKASTALAAAGGVGWKLYGGKITEAMATSLNEAGQDEWKTSYCGGCIWTIDSTRVHVRDGVAIEIEGHPDNPYNQGHICQRGQSLIANLYNPYRVKNPMKRTNPKKGQNEDPGWVEISWEEAIGTIVEKLKAVREKDPRRFALRIGFSADVNYSLLPWLVFSNAFGTPNAQMVCGNMCAVHHTPTYFHGTYVDKLDLERCNYLITAGKTIGPNFSMASGPSRALMNALERGMKFVVIDPRCTVEASKGEWLPIRPVTDLAFGLAFAHTMVYEIGIDRLDEVFLKTHTNAPYLIGDDGSYMRDPGTGKPLVWDSKDGFAKTFDDPGRKDHALDGEYDIDGKRAVPAFVKLKEHLKLYTPEWAEPITTVPAATIRRLANEFVDAASIGSTIIIDGIELPFRPVAFVAERMVASHVHGNHAHMITGLINALVGANDVPGSVLGLWPNMAWFYAPPGPDGTLHNLGGETGHYFEGRPFEWPVNAFHQPGMYPVGHSAPQIAARAMDDPKKYGLDYECDVFMTWGENTIMVGAEREEMFKSYAKPPFVFSISYHFDEPAMMADIVLPEHSVYEREQVADSHPNQAADDSCISVSGMVYKRPVVDLVYNSRQAEDIVLEICDRLGIINGPTGVNAMLNMFYNIQPEYHLDLDKSYTWAEVIDHRMKSLFGPEIGIEYLREHGMYHIKHPISTAFYYTEFPGDKVRVPVYFHDIYTVGLNLKKNLASVGLEVPPGWSADQKDLFWNQYRPLPFWEETHLFTAPKEYDLFVITWRALGRNLGIGAPDDNVFMRELLEKLEFGGMGLLMNSQTAQRKGLKHGDKVIVKSQHGGQVEGQLYVTETIHPEAVGIAGNAGRVSMHMHPVARKGMHFNELISSKEGHFDAATCSLENAARVMVEKA